MRVFAPREVLTRADTYMLRQGFSIGLNRTASTAEYTKLRRKGCLGRLLMLSPDFYRVRLSVREEQEEGRTRLTFKTSRKGNWPGVRHEIERWVAEELGGVRGPTG